MSKRKSLWSKKSFLKIVEVFLIAIMLATTAYPKTVEAAEQNVTHYKYFVIEKKWESDIESKRPSSVTIHIESIDGSYSADETLVAPDWKKAFTLPAYKDNGDEIVYAVYEVDNEDLSKYNLSNPLTNKIIISEANKNCIIIEDNTSRGIINPPYDVIANTDSFYEVPFGNIRIDTQLLLEEATREYVDEEGNRTVLTKNEIVEGSPFSYSTTTPKYANPFDKNDSEATNTVPRILYTGNLTGGDSINVEGSIVLTWPKKAVNFITGEEYGVQITVDNINIYSEVDASNKTISVMSNVNNLLEMESFVTTFGSLYENVVGVAADIQIKLVGAPSHSYAQFYVTDIDVGDYSTGYHNAYVAPGGPSSNPEDYITHGINDPFVEAVELKRGVASSIYLSGDTRLITNNGQGENRNRYVDGSGSTDVNNIKNSLKFLAEVGDTNNCYKYRWTGSKCETAIITLSTVPGEDSYTNTIKNTSSLYRVQYFFQLDNGDYPDKPDIPKTDEEIPATLVMVKPGTKVSVDANAETDPTKVDNTKKNYILDSETTDVMGTKETSSSEVTVLDVYFKKDCVVIYHDNFNDKLWNPENQTYNHLNLNDNTPVYRDGETTKIPVNPGYAFKGWSEIDYEKWSKDGTDDGPRFEPFGDVEPGKVSKRETHYLAHWEALPNEFIVHYFYEVDGQYPPKDKPDYVSSVRKEYNGEKVYTDSNVGIIADDLVPNPEKVNYILNDAMNGEWTGTVKADGLILRVYFKRKPSYNPPVTGLD